MSDFAANKHRYILSILYYTVEVTTPECAIILDFCSSYLQEMMNKLINELKKNKDMIYLSTAIRNRFRSPKQESHLNTQHICY